VAQYDNQSRVESGRGKLDAADLRRSYYVSGNADDEQVAQALIEDEFGRGAGVRAPQDDRERLLAVKELRATRITSKCLPGCARGKSPIAFLKPGEGSFCGNHRALLAG
jgi:hypothetical protein